MEYIDIVFDERPSPHYDKDGQHPSGHFLEVEDQEGKSISIGDWLEREDNYWVLRIPTYKLAIDD